MDNHQSAGVVPQHFYTTQSVSDHGRGHRSVKYRPNHDNGIDAIRIMLATRLPKQENALLMVPVAGYSLCSA